jgi:hypothetical protein
VASFTERLSIAIDANTGGFVRAMRGVNDDTKKLDRSVSGLKRGIGNFAKVAAVGLAGVGVAAVAFGSDFVKAAEESVKVGRQTEAVIKSTGGAAKVTAGDVADLAEKLSLKAGIDDEVIQSGENVLLTFKNIRDEVGKGNDIFTQATTVALDMSVAMGQDLQSSIVQVGKALNDPVAGLASLTRVGVQFTDQQKEQIKALVESGDLLGAQKIILKELTDQFEGSAAAQATASDKLKVAFGNVAEQIGLVLLPYVDQFATWMTEKGIPLIQNELIPALQDFVAWVGDELVPDLQRLGGTLRDDVLPALQALTEALVALPSAVQIALASLAVLAKFGGFGLLAGAATAMGKVIVTAFGFVGFAATTAFSWILRIAPFGHLATLAFIFRDQVSAAFGAVAGAASAAFRAVVGAGAAAVGAVAGFFRSLPGRIAGAIGTIPSIFARAMARAAGAVRDFAGDIVSAILSIPSRIAGVGGRITAAIRRGIGNIDLSPGFDIPGVPFLQHGGIVRRPTLAVVGEAGPEAVVPLGHGRMVAPLAAGGFGGGGTVVNLDMRGAIIANEQQFERMVAHAWNKATRGGLTNIQLSAVKR